jgi:phosphopantothenoylcysteine decarboxylase/phosphopantothenate--cysteine ligase
VPVIRVESSEEMRTAVLARAPSADAIIMAAAIADFRPAAPVEGKLRRGDAITLELEPTEDIATAAVTAAPDAFHVGFALEAINLVEAARAKLARKGQDLVVGNLISADHNPFGADENQVVFVSHDAIRELPRLSKEEVARLLLDEIARRLRPIPSQSSPR